jgi:hypothetical protein
MSREKMSEGAGPVAGFLKPVSWSSR